MHPFKIHILYEYGKDLRPHSSAFIRLLRPLGHPVFANKLQVSVGLEYNGQSVDAVIVDRLWRPYDISPTMAQKLVSEIRDNGAKFIYALDDNFLDLPTSNADVSEEKVTWFTKKHLWIVKFWLQEADTVVVTTNALKERFQSLNTNIIVIPNVLDDRLLLNNNIIKVKPLFPKRHLTIGYMGTLTHDDDLLMVIPTLQEIGKRYPNRVAFQLIGGMANAKTLTNLTSMTVRQIMPPLGETEYPLFMLWLTSQLSWDIAIAPLQNTEFNRGKSDLKFLDYSAMGVAGIYSDVPAYQNTVQHHNTGLLVENTHKSWLDTMETLIVQDDLRESLTRNALQYLYKERIVVQFEQTWLKILLNGL